MVHERSPIRSKCQICRQSIELTVGPDGRYWWHGQATWWPGLTATPWCSPTPADGRPPSAHVPVPLTFEEFRDFMFLEFMDISPKPETGWVGQQLFNRLLVVNRACAERIRGADGQPSFLRSRISSAWRAIEANWVG